MNWMLTAVCLTLLAGASASVVRRDASQEARICVPRKFLATCQKLYAGSGVSCVPARDRMACLERVKLREADFVVVDPEDMYVSYHLANEDFDIVSEIRTQQEKHRPFRYDGVMLVKKGSNIKQITDLKGKRSCHTGFGRNVGYKIPLTKLRKHNAFKLSSDPELSSTEKELEALSQFFEKACLVGDYSPDKLVDQIWKKRYSNLCALCEFPEKCNYPDKYSGYAGAVKCVVENQGDVAFTKSYFVKQYFGLPIGENDPSNPRSDVGDYEYLCEDGTRQPVTNLSPCSWAQRPWQGYMGNTDTLSRKTELQSVFERTYEMGKTLLNTTEQLQMFVKPEWGVYGTQEPILPGTHLFKAQYKDVIERDGTEQGVIRFCVSSNAAFLKCKWLKRAAYSRDIRPQLECLEKDTDQCIQAVRSGKADAMVVQANDVQRAEEADLTQIMSEVYGDVYVGLVDADADPASNPTVQFDASNLRALTATQNLLKLLGRKTCSPTSVEANPTVKIVSSKDLPESGKKLLCADLSKKELGDFRTCNLDYSLPNGIYVKKSETRQVKDNIRHAFSLIAKQFGPEGKQNDVFDLFGEFQDGERNVIFSSDSVDIYPEPPQNVDKKTYFDLHCSR